MKAVKFSAVISLCGILFAGCSKGSEKQAVIYSNADDEAVVAAKKALDENGFAGKYLFQTFGSSELGGKLMAEGTDIEADVVTMTTFYLDSAQAQNNMFSDLIFKEDSLESYPSFYYPILATQGALILNTKLMAEKNFPRPASIKDLGNPVYKDWISVVDIMGGTSAWRMIQALLTAYGEDGTKEVLTAIYKNAGPHLELSGSGPLKKVRAGEVAIGFGLRHQAVADKAKGLPIDYVDPVEGNFSMTESVAVVNKGKKTNPLAMQMAQCIIEKGRPYFIQDYPVVLYKGESVGSENVAMYPAIYKEPLTVELLKKHQQLSESCK